MDYPLKNIPICVLDYDGVVHHGEVYYAPGVGVYMREPGHALFEWADILTELLTPYPDVRIALSTSWVRSRGFEFAKAALPSALRNRIVGATFHNREVQKAEFDLMSRGQQVLNYVERRGLTRWFAIDDDVAGWPAWCQNKLVRTQEHLGISELSVQQAIQDCLSKLYTPPKVSA